MTHDEYVTKTAIEYLSKKKNTQRKLAEKMGITESYLSQLINGRRRWTFNMIRSFATASGIEINLNF